MLEPEVNLDGSYHVVCGSLGTILEPLSGVQKIKTLFINSIKTLFASFTVLTFTLMGKIADALAWIMTVVPNYTSGHSILHNHILTEQTEPVSLKNVLDQAVKMLWNLNEIWSFKKFCVIKWKQAYSVSAAYRNSKMAISKRSTCVIKLWAKLGSSGNIFTWKNNWKTNSSDSGFGRHFLKDKVCLSHQGI